MPENKQKLTFTNKLILIILPIIVILFCCYNISTSNLICSSYSGCKIVEQNLFRYTMKEKRVNLDSISKFYVSSSIDVTKISYLCINEKRRKTKIFLCQLTQ